MSQSINFGPMFKPRLDNGALFKPCPHRLDIGPMFPLYRPLPVFPISMVSGRRVSVISSVLKKDDEGGNQILKLLTVLISQAEFKFGMTTKFNLLGVSSASVEPWFSIQKKTNPDPPTPKLLYPVTPLMIATIMVRASQGTSDDKLKVITGKDLMMRMKSIVRIKTGSRALDELLGGSGIETMAFTEAFGESRSGKTQLAHTLCVTAQHGGKGNEKVVFLDTQGTFRPDRIVQIAKTFGMAAEAVLENIIYHRVYTYQDQYDILLDLSTKMKNSEEQAVRLLVVDSVIALFRVEFIGPVDLAERHQKLAQTLSLLKMIAHEFNVAVFVTNQLISDPGEEGMSISDPKKPSGGLVLAQAATVRLMFSKGQGEQRICKVFYAPHLPEAEAIFQITPGGIADADAKDD